MNNTPKRNLDFHQTFKPERNCLNALLTDLRECCGKGVQEISQITGIPTGKSSGKSYTNHLLSGIYGANL